MRLELTDRESERMRMAMVYSVFKMRDLLEGQIASEMHPSNYRTPITAANEYIELLRRMVPVNFTNDATIRTLRETVREMEDKAAAASK